MEFFVEFNGKQYKMKDIEAIVKKNWLEQGNKVKDMKGLKCYYNIGENKIYAVPNNKIEEQFIVEI